MPVQVWDDDKTLWSNYMQYVTEDGTPCTDVRLYQDDRLLEWKVYTGLRPVDGLLMARTHILAWLACHANTGLLVTPIKYAGGFVQPPLPGMDSAE